VEALGYIKTLGSKLGIPDGAKNVFISDSGGTQGKLDKGDYVVYTDPATNKQMKVGLSPEDVTNIEYAKNGISASDKLRKGVDSGRISFNGDINGQQYNPEKWKKVPDPVNPTLSMWAPNDKARPPVSSADAIRDVFEGKKGSYEIDCAASSNLTNLYKELQTIGPEAFNSKYKGLSVGGWDITYDKFNGGKQWDRDGGADKVVNVTKDTINEEKKVKVDGKDQTVNYQYVDRSKLKSLKDSLVPGDPIYFRNPDTGQYRQPMQGENAIFQGYNAQGKPMIVCNPGGQKEIIPSKTPDGKQVWAIDMGGGELFYLAPNLFVHNMADVNANKGSYSG